MCIYYIEILVDNLDIILKKNFKFIKSTVDITALVVIRQTIFFTM